MYPIVHLSTIYNSQDMEATQMSIDRCMDTETVVYIHTHTHTHTHTYIYTHTMEYQSTIKRHISESVLMRWMNLEPIIQSEVSHKEKNKYHILTHKYGIQKDGTDESICRAAMEMQTQRTDMWTRWGKEREGQIETVALKHIHLNRQQVGICCMTQGAQTWCSVTTQRGGMGWQVEGNIPMADQYTYG